MGARRVGGCFAGYGGLEMAVRRVFPDAEPVWFSEVEPAPSRILAHHWPAVPNLGDITRVDWSQVEPVDVITGGSPCQDVSSAGKRAGMVSGTRSNLWESMREGVAVLRPSLVIWENVRGALSARAASDVEQEPGRLGNGQRRPALRALGRVLGDLASLGYDATWCGLRAADVGAPHGRFRIFVVAWPSEDPAALSWPSEDPAALLPTPAVNDMGRAYTPDEALRLLPTPTVSEANGAGEHGTGGVDLRTAVSLLPTPRATDGTKGGPNQRGSSGDLMLPSAVLRREGYSDGASAWGLYATAVERWEMVLGRPAPGAVEPTGRDGAHRLSARAVEWMMGLPEGHVTDVPGITRNDMLKALGNGVVPQQAAEGIAWCIEQARATEAVA